MNGVHVRLNLGSTVSPFWHHRAAGATAAGATNRPGNVHTLSLPA